MKIAKMIERFADNHYSLRKDMREIEHGYMNIYTNPHHLEGSIWSHTCMVLKEAEKNKAEDWMKVSCLCHDLGKTIVFEDDFGKQRRRFNNHEGVSVFLARDVLDTFSDIIKPWDYSRIYNVIANHGSLYNYFEEGQIPEKFHDKIRAKFTKNQFKDLVEFYEYDHQGRITSNPKGFSEDLIFDDLNKILMGYMGCNDDFHKTKVMPSKRLTVLVGPSNSGKSTFRKSLNTDAVIISRDDTLMNYGTFKWGDMDYSEIWEKLKPEDHKEIDKTIQKLFQDSLREGKSIIIDMTSMSKKSRRRWINPAKQKDYFVDARVFIESPVTLKERSKNNKEKNIPEEVIDMFIKNFGMPHLDEVDLVNIV